ncbi:TPA: hypothetical protein DCX15_06355 [bacterium]|nr:hypothetical protein [bacterium]
MKGGRLENFNSQWDILDYLILRFIIGDILTTGRIRATFMDGRCIVPFYGHQELWTPAYLYKVVKRTKFKIIKKFSLQSFTTIFHLLSYIPKDLVNEYYKVGASVPPGEDGGIGIGVVCEKIC